MSADNKTLRKAFHAQLRQQVDLLLPKLRDKRGFSGISIRVKEEFADAAPPQGWYIAVYSDPKRVAAMTKATEQAVQALQGEGKSIDVPVEVAALEGVELQDGSVAPAPQ